MRSMLFVPADSERKLARGLESRRRRADPRSRGLGRRREPPDRPQAGPRLSGSARPGDRVLPLCPHQSAGQRPCARRSRRHGCRPPDGILLPKCLPEDVRTLDHYLSAFEAAAGAPVGDIRIIAIATETPQAVFALGGYAGVSPRLEAITWGAEDLSACLGGNNKTIDGEYDGPYQLARSLCLLAAAAAEVAAIDTIYTDFKDPEGLKAECLAARRSGFAAKMAIHPAQLATINEAFSVSAAEREWAERVIAAFAAQPGCRHPGARRQDDRQAASDAGPPPPRIAARRS